MRRAAPLLAGVAALVAVAVAVAATRTAETTTGSPIVPEDGWLTPYRVAVAAAFLAYLAGVVVLARRRAPLAAVAAVACAIQLAPLAAPLLLSKDAYIYWAYGRIAGVHGDDPYAQPPSAFPEDPAHAYVAADWLDTTAAYGPLWVLASEGVARAAGDDVDTAMPLYKLLGAAGALALVAAAGAAARRRALAVAFVGWNPLLALHFAGGAHNDAWMMAFVVAGIALALHGRPNLGGASWAAGVAVKWFPLVLLPLELVGARRGVRPFGWLGFAAGGLALALLATARYGFDWPRAIVPIGNQAQRWNSLSLVHWLTQAGIPGRPATLALVLLFGLAYLWLLREAWRGRVRLALASGLFALSLAWLAPWYATWAIALAPVEEDRVARWLALALTAYFLRDVAPWSS
ncbi:MAG TPA: polyprenol phosphomannose-dependent alpha 1,6 mannosyltransferase MptB [Gaiellaceae bacterium]|nr:polyprenol phosphomannose-dependent alpha 1,6 mannosyltransferase MptB [Gaiellaceae bacterium]